MIVVLGVISLIVIVNAWTGPVAVVGFVGLNLMKGLFEPLIQDSLYRRISSEKRASCLSAAHMGINFLGFFLGPLFGFLADVYSLETSLTVVLWTFGPMLLVGMIWGWRVLGRRREPGFTAGLGQV